MIYVYIEYSYKKNYWEKAALTAWEGGRWVIFHIMLACPSYSKGKREPTLCQHLNQSNRQFLMTLLSVSFKATLKAINTIKFQIYVLLQLSVKKTGRNCIVSQ